MTQYYLVFVYSSKSNLYNGLGWPVLGQILNSPFYKLAYRTSNQEYKTGTPLLQLSWKANSTLIHWLAEKHFI